MEKQNQIEAQAPKRRRQQQEANWGDVAKDFGLMVLQGVIVGAAGALGSRAVNSALSPGRPSSGESADVISLRRDQQAG